jgi:FtsP/CotA-like multicopper oxidase with cupredoxin domain
LIDVYRQLRTDPELESERAGLAAHLERPPDKTLQFIGEMDMSGMDMGPMDMSGMDMGSIDMGATEMGSKELTGLVTSSMVMGVRHGNEAQAMQGEGMHDMSDHPDPVGMHHQGMGGEEAHSMHPAETDDGIEWEDTMPEMNVMSNLSNMTWKIIDTATGAANNEISWTLHVGDRVKIRLDNSAGSDHQMHHPFHVHGAGRFLVLDRGGIPEPNLAWKDTVLVRAGEVVHILFDVTNPGRWMAHCHIAEHIESGMMFSFDVLQTAAAGEATR